MWGIVAVYGKISTRWRQGSISAFSFFSPLFFLMDISLSRSFCQSWNSSSWILFLINIFWLTRAPAGLYRSSFFCAFIFICHDTVTIMCMFDWGSVSFFSALSTELDSVFSEHVPALFRVFTSELENWKKWELSSAWPCWGWTDSRVSTTITTCWISRATSLGHTRKLSG